MGTTTIGGTWDTKVPDGYEEFFGESAGQGTWNYATISKSSSYNVYKDALDEQCPIHFGVVHFKSSRKFPKNLLN